MTLLAIHCLLHISTALARPFIQSLRCCHNTQVATAPTTVTPEVLSALIQDLNTTVSTITPTVDLVSSLLSGDVGQDAPDQVGQCLIIGFGVWDP